MTPLEERGQSADAIARRDGRNFAFTIAGGFVAIGLLAARKHRHATTAISLGLAAVSLLAGIVVPTMLLPVRRRWIQLGELIGLVTTPVMMAAVYYLLLTPAGALRRFRHHRAAETPGWRRREPLPPASRMERQF